MFSWFRKLIGTSEEMNAHPNTNMHANASHYLTQCVDIRDDKSTSLKDLMEKSQNFPIKFPIRTMTCQALLKDRKDVSEKKLEQFVNSAYPLLHESVLHLLIDFLEYKKQNGTAEEKQMYANMGVIGLVDRLLNKRAVAFVGTYDAYLLPNGKSGSGGWEKIGKGTGSTSLSLENCLSYDEIKLSAFLSVSSHSFFINAGKRGNVGVPSRDINSFQRDGVIIGLIGARMEKADVMEWEEIIISKKQNTAKNGYGPCNKDNLKLHNWRRLWAEFYGVKTNFPLYLDAQKTRDRYTRLGDIFFNDDVFRKRIQISAETFLLDAESRAAKSNKTAYVRVVGFGLGVWRISAHQTRVFIESFIDCLKRMYTVLPHVSDVEFLWLDESECGEVKYDGTSFKREDGSGIRLHFSRDAPHSLVENDKLLVASYAWDGNALPGNEFWEGALSASGDPAEACSSQVAELHNPHINKNRVCGECLHIASPQWGVLHVSEYARRQIQEIHQK